MEDVFSALNWRVVLELFPSFWEWYYQLLSEDERQLATGSLLDEVR